MRDSCQGVVGLFILGRYPGDELRIITLIQETLRKGGCENVHLDGWVVSCCEGTLVKAYAVLERGSLGAVTSGVRVAVEGACPGVLNVVRLLAEAAQGSGYPTLLSGQEGLVEGGLRLG